ncbi:MAG: flagellar hook-length control protein FliK [Bordetella sp.]|nr:flagellar hook-length control protein FliK [Bordetella sp.]
MSAVSLMSVLTPAAPGGGSLDASAEAAADGAVFAGLMLREEAAAASPADPVAEVPETAAPAELPEDEAAAGPPPAIWFAPPPPPPTQEPAPQTSADPTTPVTEGAVLEADPVDLRATAEAALAPQPSPAAPLAGSSAGGDAPVAAPGAASVSAPVAPPVAPAAPAQSDASSDSAPGEGEGEGEGRAGASPAPATSRLETPPLPRPDAAPLGVTGFRSGAGERLASAREAIQAAAASTEADSEATAAGRAASPDAPALAADAGANAARSGGPPSSIAAAALAASSADSKAAAPPPEALDGTASQTTGQIPGQPLDQTPGAQRDLGLSQLSRATVETTAQIAAQIIKKLDGRSTRFDMALTPEGLGRVDVSLEIESDGQVTARLAFDNPAAAADLRARADELRRQLLDAGLQLSPDDLEFAQRDPSSGFGGGGFEREPDRRAFLGAARVAAEADSVLPAPGAWTSLSLTPDRVDLKV